jgi:hypothetical protein
VTVSAVAAAVDPNKVTPGLLGFLVVLGLGLATWVLLRSMNRQLKKVDFDDASGQDRPGESAAPNGRGDRSPPEVSSGP